MNTENVKKLAEHFLARPKEFFYWLVECCDTFEPSRTLFFLILLESFMMPIEGKCDTFPSPLLGFLLQFDFVFLPTML